ncbi:FCD domain-containing protein [uncultured Paracoccus sp.]|uniref:FadR/GntR family transcriptional regulator n=1 Tax=uncultured Paracoccus sp. TaxID=189685 RepID=UPI002626CC7D|nr:FCD domain-containing protein [uncultured Paracoccus sp.]
MPALRDDISDLIETLRPLLRKAAEKDGGRLPPERSMAELLDVPRRRLRLALDELQHQGAVFRRHGQGTFVTPAPHPDKDRHRLLAGRVSLDQLMDVRLQLEPRLAQLAAIHADRDDLVQLEALMRRTREARDPAEYDRADEVFHYRIAELSQNPLFLEIYDLVRGMRREAGWRERRVKTNVPEMIGELGAQHQTIFEAIASNDPEAAGDAVRRHMIFVASAVAT